MGYHLTSIYMPSSTGNEIGAEGARALAKSLKQNKTLAELNLGGILEPHELLIRTT